MILPGFAFATGHIRYENSQYIPTKQTLAEKQSQPAMKEKWLNLNLMGVYEANLELCSFCPICFNERDYVVPRDMGIVAIKKLKKKKPTKIYAVRVTINSLKL